MSASRDICVVCAWRADCRKKFSVSGKSVRCPDFVRDLSLPKDGNEDEEAQENRQSGS